MATLQYKYIVETGLIVPDTDTTKTEVTEEYVATFGADLVISDNTPQGVFIVTETTARDGLVRNNAAVANQINPNEAGGIALDAVMALTGAERIGDTFSSCPCDLTGVPGTIVPSGSSQIKNSNGDIFQLLDTVTLDVNGMASGVFVAILPGPISGQAGTLTTIYLGPLGWETVNNTVNATLGTLQQSDEEARDYRRNTLVGRGRSMALATTAGLYATPGVKTLSYRENDDSVEMTIDGVLMKPHSIFVCVDGGSDDDVANVMLDKKSGGCGYSNSQGIPVTVNVVEPASGQTYAISFSRPDIILYDAQVTASIDNSVVGNPTELIKSSIIAYTNSAKGLAVGVPVSSFELAGAINIDNPGIFVKNLGIRYSGSGSFTPTELPIELWQKANTTSTLITVIIV